MHTEHPSCSLAPSPTTEETVVYPPQTVWAVKKRPDMILHLWGHTALKASKAEVSLSSLERIRHLCREGRVRFLVCRGKEAGGTSGGPQSLLGYSVSLAVNFGTSGRSQSFLGYSISLAVNFGCVQCEWIRNR